MTVYFYRGHESPGLEIAPLDEGREEGREEEREEEEEGMREAISDCGRLSGIKPKFVEETKSRKEQVDDSYAEQRRYGKT